MKPKIINLAAFVLLLAACSSNDLNEVENQVEGDKVPVKVHVNEFSVSMVDFDEPTAGARSVTRAEDAEKYANVQAVTLAFYDIKGTEVYKQTQAKSDKKTDTTFGEFSADLQIGHYTMVALGYNVGTGDVFTLTSPTQAAFTSEKPREMFCLTQSVTVTKSAPLDLEVTLNPISAWLNILSTDNAAPSVTKVRTTYSKGGKSFSPSSGLAISDAGFSQTQSANVVSGKLSVHAFPMLFTDEETMDITIDALDKNNVVLFSKVISDVNFKRGYKTTIQGPVFTAGTSSAGFMFNTGWGEEKTYTFE